MNAQQHFRHRLVVVDPPFLRCRLEHRIFSTDVVRGDGAIAVFLQSQNHIEVAQRRLDHEHVRTFCHVEFCFPQRLVPVGGIHLVRLLVSEFGSALQCIAERSVEGARILGGVAEDGRVGMSRGVQRVSDDAHPSVHHVRRSDAVETCLCLNHGHFCKNGQRQVIGNLAFLNNPVMTVRTVRVHRHITHQPCFRKALLDFTGDVQVEILLGHPVARACIFEVLLHRRKQHEGRHAQFHGRFHLPQRVVYGQAIDAWHGCNRLPLGRTIQHKQGENQMSRRKVGFPHHATDCRGTPISPWPLRQIVDHAQGLREFNSFTKPSSSARIAFCNSKWSASDKSSMDS